MACARASRRLVLFLTVCLLLAVGLVWVFWHGSQPGAGMAGRSAPTPPVAGAASPSGAAAAPALSARPAIDVSAIPRTRLPLLLLATVVRQNPARSLATILDTERSEAAVMNEGQPFEGRPNVRLTAIERERVLIDNDGVREQLVFVHEAAERVETAGLEIAPEERERRRALALRLRELTDSGSAALRRGERGGLLAEGDVRAVYEDGELVGVGVDAIRAGGLYDRIGLHNGDVVTEINGVSLSDPGAMALVAAQVATSEVLELTVTPPDGPPTSVQLPTGELERLVESGPGAGSE